MRLFHSPLSPFVRKVSVVAAELGIADRITRETLSLTPVDTPDALAAANPLGKIPTLELDDGTVLFDSTVICEYLDAEFGGGRLTPSSGPARWHVRRLEALGNGMLEAGVLVRYETAVRPETLRWPEWIAAQHARIARSLDMLEAEAATLGDEPNMGTIAVGCALGYLDFRFPDADWRDGRPALTSWFEGWSQRASMRDSTPA